MSRPHIVRVVALAVVLGGCHGRTPAVSPPAESEPRPAPPALAPVPAAAPARPDVTVAAAESHADTVARRVAELGSGSGRLAADHVGYYMDVQQARLQQLGKDRVRVARKDSRLVLTLVARSSFESGSVRLARDVEGTLTALATTLREFDKTVVSVVGHTDASGSEAANRTLSERRALAVARFLIENGVDRRRLVVVGRGQSNPVASNDTEEGRERNRRIEIYLDPIRR